MREARLFQINDKIVQYIPTKSLSLIFCIFCVITPPINFAKFSYIIILKKKQKEIKNSAEWRINNRQNVNKRAILYVIFELFFNVEPHVHVCL